MGSWSVVAVDMDGTLTRGVTACQHLDAGIFCTDVISDLERRYANGEIDNTQVAELHGPYYAGIALTDIAARMATVPCIDDIEEGVQLLRSRGVVPVIATVSWSFAAAFLAERFGFAAASGARMGEIEGRLTGEVVQHFEREHKVDFVKAVCAQHQVSMASVVAIGDGHSDLPLFEAAGFSVALNASDSARRAATTAVDSDSFLDALRAVPGLID
jgi:phosphoserine phosphatase